MIAAERGVLAGMLSQYGEDELARLASGFSDDVMDRIGTLGAYYAWSDEAIALGGSMGGARAMALATLDVVDGSGRPLSRHHSEAEVRLGWSAQPTGAEALADRELRRQAAQRQIPADQAKVCLDALDPPAWDRPPSDATAEQRRCHELRAKPLRQFTEEDLLFMIQRQVGLHRLVNRAICKLRSDPLLQADRFPGDLLMGVLRVDATFWKPHFDMEVAARRIAETILNEPHLEPGLRDLTRTFLREHPPRSAASIPD